MKKIFKIFFLIALSLFTSFNLNALHSINSGNDGVILIESAGTALGQDATQLHNKFNGFEDLTKIKFLDDFEDAIDDVKIIFNTNPSLIDAWKKVIGRAYSTDVPFFEKLSEIMEPSVLNKLPNGEADLDVIIAALVHPHIGASHTFLKQAAEHLDDIKHLVTNFDGVEGFDKVITALKNPNFFAQDGASHLLTKLKTLNASNVAKLEGKIVDADNLAGICANCLFDIQLSSGKKLELKSYSESTIGNISGSSQFKNQFKAYLADADNMDEFEYVFNSKKIGDNSTLVKDNFKTLFQQNNHSIYDDILNTNPNSTVFSSVGINTKGQFIQAVNNTGHDLYKFIDIL
ncbi:hypothetical protein FEZ18_03505 [Oceanihabitans sp. IOP_32]|uniref:hypothetical protein n=1 Tax=Oceanihabitans sp. IOP_32 TaxID=2529032 RepID=UPI0012935B84|nr:hypothetical protein [Oceanihabitans sp. IOP_32]QFZ53941.1 hypothetical protein FEZ18_03505 [Oceanihabitans sp. IOP_32]